MDSYGTLKALTVIVSYGQLDTALADNLNGLYCNSMLVEVEINQTEYDVLFNT